MERRIALRAVVAASGWWSLVTTPAFQRDPMVIPLLRQLRRCAAEQLALSGRNPCRFPITWNAQQPPADACDCFCGYPGTHGQAWVRWTETQPADMGGGKMPPECAGGMFEFTLELGVYRCWPVPEGGPLDEGEEELAALGMLLDAAALRRAVVCCDWDEDQQWEIDKEEPVSHQGGCTGVVLTLKVRGSDCDCSYYEPPMTPQHAGNR